MPKVQAAAAACDSQLREGELSRPFCSVELLCLIEYCWYAELYIVASKSASKLPPGDGAQHGPPNALGRSSQWPPLRSVAGCLS